jgi:hypothetical protein
MAITAMLRKLLVIRATDSMALTLASMTVALTMTERGGVDGYARFVVIILVGTTAGGPLAYLALNVWRIPVFAPLIATVSAGSRIVLVLVLIIAREQSWPLEVAGLLVAASSVSLPTMVHSLISVGGGSIQDRTNLLSATAVGSLAGTLGAGLVIEWNRWPALVIMQAVAGAAGFLLVRIYVRAFLRQPQPVPIAVRPRLRDGLPSWSRMGPIVWRVPVIAGVAFAIGSLVPGVVATSHGAVAGSVAGAAYLLGAIGSTVLTRVVDIRRPRVGSWFADQRRWFLAATAGSLPWLLLVGPLWLGMIAVMIAGTILHLIQAGYEQAAAALDVPERSGPLIVALASVAGVASAVSIAVMPMIVTRIGFVNLVITVIVIMTTLALLDRRRARNVAAC